MHTQTLVEVLAVTGVIYSVLYLACALKGRTSSDGVFTCCSEEYDSCNIILNRRTERELMPRVAIRR